MAIALEKPGARLAELRPLTRCRLESLGVRDLDLPADLAEAVGSGGQELRAGHWSVGSPVVAECRTVVITGSSSAIFNALVFPRFPALLPVLVAELLVLGNQPRLAFVDLQDGGLAEQQRVRVVVRAQEIARRHRHLPRDSQVPAWAIRFSTGAYTYTRPEQASPLEEWLTMYTQYLDAWIDLAQAWHAAPESGDALLENLRDFKSDHLAHWPGKDYLAKLFGAAWTDRFLNLFLYR